MEIINVIIKTVPLFLAIIIGYRAKQTNFFGENGAQVIQKIVFKIVSPFLVFSVLHGLTFTSSNINLLIYGVVIFLLLFIFAWYLGRIFKFDLATNAAFTLSMIGFGVGGFAYPFILLNFDHKIFNEVVLIDILLFLLFITFGSAFAKLIGKKTKLSLKAFKPVLMDPVVLTVVITFITNYLGLKLPEVFINTGQFFANAFGLLVALLIGISLKFDTLSSSIKQSGYFVLRLITVFAIVVALKTILPLSSTQTIAMFLTVSSPFSVMAIIYSQEEGFNAPLAAKMNVFSIMVSLVSYPLIIAYFLR